MRDTSLNVIIYALLLPFAGALIQVFLGKTFLSWMGNRLGKIFMGTLAVLSVVASFAIIASVTLRLFDQIPRIVPQKLHFWHWIDLVNLSIPFELLVDPLSMTMALIVTGVGALIHLYATAYMGKDRDYTRFFTYMNLFIGFMLLLVLANNLVLLFIGWEGVGLCSYLLIGFWYEDLANTRAANKAFLMNRIGDAGFMVGLFLLAVTMMSYASELGIRDPRWLSYDILLPSVAQFLGENSLLATVLALLLFMGAVGKSAQFPLYTWLPDAMAGPTPVSALIHAATMVTAGVFLVNRLHVFFEFSPLASAVVAGIGAFTAILAALIAFGQTDIKRVLAYSTVSQLGYMFIACGVGAYWVGIFHVVTQAFIKALLFLGAGAVIQAMAHEQDMRKFGNLWKYLPATMLSMIIGWLAISGLPFLSGYWSKEAILASAFGSAFPEIGGVAMGTIVGWVGIFVSLLTAAYMTRMMILTFGVPFVKGEERWRKIQANPELETREASHGLTPEHSPKEVGLSMQVPLGILAGLSLVGGYVLQQGNLLENFLAVSTWPTFLAPSIVKGRVQDWVSSSLVWMTVAASLLGIFYGLLVYWRGLPRREGLDTKQWGFLRRVLYAQLGYDAALTFLGEKGGGSLSSGLWRLVERGTIDGFVNMTGYLTVGLGGVLRRLQNGYVRFYALIMLLGGIGLLVYFVYAFGKVGGLHNGY